MGRHTTQGLGGPALSGLIRHVSAQRPRVMVPTIPAADGARRPASFAQQRMWTAENVLGGESAYNDMHALRVKGDIDPERLGIAIRLVAAGHDVLRTAFEQESSGDLVQVIGACQPGAPEFADLSTGSANEVESRADTFCREFAARAFDLRRGPLLRTAVLRLAAGSILVFCAHHMIIDGWSWRLLVGEVGAKYEELTRLGTAESTRAPVQYADFAVWQRKRCESAVVRGQEAYWAEQLAGTNGCLELPSDRPRPPVARPVGSRVLAELSEEVTAAVHGAAREYGVSAFTVLLSCFAVLVYRLSGQDDLIIGVPVAGRMRSEFESALGCFINTLPLRIFVKPHDSFIALSCQVKETALAAFDNQEVPFERIIQASGVPRDPSRAPLVQTMFAYQRVDPGPGIVRWGSLSATPYEIVTDRARLDLTLLAWDDGTRIRLACEYSSDLFDKQTAARILDWFTLLLTQALTSPDSPVGKATLVRSVDLALYRQVNSTRRPVAHGTVLDCFDEHVRLRPDAVAVRDGQRNWTYARLAREAGQIATLLADSGVRTGDVVGIHMRCGAEMIAAQIAVWLAGGAFLILDPDLPTGRLQFMAEDSGVGHVLVDDDGDGLAFPALPVPVQMAAGRPAARPATMPRPGDAAYIIYTSGSTGSPKGVCVEHRGLPSVIHAQARLLDIRPGDTVLRLAAPTFDASVFETIMALGNGASVCVPGTGKLLPGPELAGLVDDVEITHMVIVPSALSMLPIPARPPRVVCVAGEECPPSLAERWSRVCRFHNLYGPTEATIWATEARIAHGAPRDPGEVGTRRLPIGRPIDNTFVAVVSPDGAPLPIGLPGELWIGGNGVARGYLGRPALTGQKFIRCPASLTPLGFDAGSPVYRTGDKVLMLPSGDLRFMGRTDRQVKVRGVRIELGEIEAVLEAHPDVAQAVVVLRADVVGDQALAAYVTARPGCSVRPALLTAYLSGLLPSQAVPSTLTPLREMPRTQAGKVDHAALPAPEAPAGPRRADRVEPTATGLESQICELTAEVLGVPAVGLGDDFFAIGGDSLKAVRLAGRATALGVPIVTADVILHQSPRALASVVASRQGLTTGQRAEDRPACQDSRANGHTADALALTGFQQFALERYRASGDPGSYLVVSTYGMRGARWRPEIFEQAWNNTVRDHSILRSRFAAGAGGLPELRVADHASAPFEYRDVAHLPVADALQQVAELTDSEWRTGFDLNHAPYMRSTLVRLPQDRHVLLWTRQHMIMDGWSRSPVLESFFAHYDLLVGARAEPPEPTDFGDLTHALAGLDAKSARQYWRDQLAGFSPVPLDTLREGLVPKGSVARVAVELDPELASAVNRAADYAGLTQYEFLRGTLAIAMASMLGSDDVLFAQMASGRAGGPSGIERIVGNTLRIVPSRFRIDASTQSKPWHEWVRSQRRAMLEAEQHAHIPVRSIVEAAGLPEGTELFDCYLVNEQYPTGQSVATRTAAWEALGTIVPVTTVPYRMEILGGESSITVSSVYYGPQRAETARSLLDAWSQGLRSAAWSPDIVLGALVESTSQTEGLQRR